MAPPHIPSPQKRQPAEDDNDSMMLAATPGCTSTAAGMSSFVTTSMEQDDETNWDSESDRPPWWGYCPVGMSDEYWAEDNIDMGDYLAHADEPPTVSDKRIEGASGIVEVPTIATHPPDPMHLSTPEESPHTGDDEDADNPASKENATDDLEVEEEAPTADVVIKEEYFEKQEEEEVHYEDDAPIEECEEVVEDGEQVAEVNEDEETTVTEVKEPTVSKQLGDPVDE